MPAAKKYVVCKCSECVGGFPDGRSMLASARSAHLNRVARELEQVDKLANDMFALGFSDDSPNIEDYPNKLWTSREEFQDDNIRNQPPVVPPVSDIVQGMQRLALATTSQTSRPPNLPDALPTVPPTISARTPPVSLSRPPPSPVDRIEVQRESNRATTIALQLLYAIQAQAVDCEASFALVDSVEARQLGESSLSQILADFRKVTRPVASVDTLRAEVKAQLDRLSVMLVELQSKWPDRIDIPIFYSCGEPSLFYLLALGVITRHAVKITIMTRLLIVPMPQHSSRSSSASFAM